MRFKGFFAVLAVMLVFMSGCLNQKAYVEPSFQKVDFSDIQQSQTRHSVGVLVEFQRHSQPLPSVSGSTREIVIQTLKQSNLFTSVSSGVVGTDARIELTVNNVTGETQGSGFATGLTLGAASTKTTDPYIITASYHVEGKDPVKKTYNHKLHCNLGAGGFGKDIKTMSVGEAFNQVVEDCVLRFLKDLQTEGVI